MNIHPKVHPILILLLTSLALAQPTASLTVKDDFTSVTVRGRPTRVVASHPISLELLLALGVQPVGYAGAPEGTRLGAPLKSIPKYTDLLKSEPVFVGDPPNLETIAALKPDLILTTNLDSADAEKQLRQIAPTLIFEYARGDGWQRAIVPLGKVLGREKQAAAVLAAVNRQSEASRKQVAGVVKAGRTVVLFGVIGSDLYLFGPTFPGSLQFKDMGFAIAAPAGEAFKPISAEGILNVKADRAVLLSYSASPQAQATALTFMKRNGYKTIHLAEPDIAARFTTGPLSDIQILKYYAKLMTSPGVKP